MYDRLHGRVCHRASTPDKSGSNVKRRRKKKKKIATMKTIAINICLRTSSHILIIIKVVDKSSSYGRI